MVLLTYCIARAQHYLTVLSGLKFSAVQRYFCAGRPQYLQLCWRTSILSVLQLYCQPLTYCWSCSVLARTTLHVLCWGCCVLARTTLHVLCWSCSVLAYSIPVKRTTSLSDMSVPARPAITHPARYCPLGPATNTHLTDLCNALPACRLLTNHSVGDYLSGGARAFSNFLGKMRTKFLIITKRAKGAKGGQNVQSEGWELCEYSVL